MKKKSRALHTQIKGHFEIPLIPSTGLTRTSKQILNLFLWRWFTHFFTSYIKDTNQQVCWDCSPLVSDVGRWMSEWAVLRLLWRRRPDLWGAVWGQLLYLLYSEQPRLIREKYFWLIGLSYNINLNSNIIGIHICYKQLF